MAGALYNRYRPRTFGEVIGQGHVTDALRRALEKGTMHHAYLFSGPRGCGKTSSARILAASLNCVNGPTPEPCGVCDNCVAIRNGSSVDVVELDAASNGGVDDTRDLRDRAAYAPASSRFRVFIIDEAHMITTAGFNALLKLVEEPPPHVRFVFATTDPDKVIPTIKSRTFHYQFGLVPPGVLREHLKRVAAEEGAVVEEAVYPLVVRVGEGSVRDSLSVLDQLLAGAEEEGLTYPLAAQRLGLTDSVLLDEALDALADADGATLFGVVERVVAAGQDPRRFAQDLLERLRDLILLAVVPDARDRGLLEMVGEDQLTRMRGQAGRLGLPELSRAGDVVHEALLEMRGTTSPRLVLELLIARLLLPAAAADEGGVLVRLDRLERRLDASPAGAPVSTAGGLAGARERVAADRPLAAVPVEAPAPAPVAPTPPPPPAPAPAALVEPGEDLRMPEVEPVRAAAPEPEHEPPAEPPASAVEVGATPAGSDPDLAGLTRVWNEVLGVVAESSKVAHTLLSQYASVTSVEGTRVTVTFSNPGQGRNFEQRSDVLGDALGRVLGGRWTVVVGGATPPPAAAPAAAPPPPPPPASPAAEEEPPPPAYQRREVVPPPPPDEPSEDDEILPSTSGQAGEEAALAMLREQLGGQVLGELDG